MRKIRVILTAKDTDLRLTEIQNISLRTWNNEKVDVRINKEKRFQNIIGFGGAFTEAAAYTLSKISVEKRQEIINAYYDKKDGLGYSLGRVHINSCDFALENYTYVKENDIELKTFDISRDRKWVLPLIKDAVKARNEDIKLVASPWSPPAWMKSNKKMNNGGHLLPEYYRPWANYYAKFIKEYKKEGTNIWAITVQNEPQAVQTWDSCIYTADEERNFVKNYLGPVMYKENMNDIKILIWDHNRDEIVRRTAVVLNDPGAAKYIWGTGFHWYASEKFENIGKVHEMFPNKHLLFTEGCVEGGVKLGSWKTGERYGRNIIGDLNNWTEGYLDWNIVLNEKGGPNHVGNFCDAPIIADTRVDRIYYNSSYYYIGHFSKFIKPGAVRIGFENSNDSIYCTAFLNEDGTTVIVLMNEKNENINFNLGIEESIASLNLKAHSIATYLI